MASRSAIEWTEVTWNPVTGCDRVSAGCEHCYALTLARRLKAMGAAKYQHDGDPRTSGPGFGVSLHREALREPYGWRTPRVVFVNSMSDLFHAKVDTGSDTRRQAGQGPRRLLGAPDPARGQRAEATQITADAIPHSRAGSQVPATPGTAG